MSSACPIEPFFKGGPKVGQKVGHFFATGLPFLSDCEINELRDNGGLLSVKMVAHLSDVPLRSIKRYCKDKKYVNSIQVKGNGGMQWRIPLEDAARDLKPGVLVWISEQLKRSDDEVPTDGEAVLSDLLHEKAEAEALVKYEVVRIYQEALSGARHGEKMAAKEAFVLRFNGGEWPDLLDAVGPVAWKTIDTHWLPRLRQAGEKATVLAPRYRYSRDGDRKLTASALVRQFALEEFLSPSAPKVSEVVRAVNAKLEGMGMPAVKEWVVRSYLKDYGKQHGSMVTICRESEKAYNDHCAPWVMRNPDLIEFGDQFEADGHTVNFNVADPIRGKDRRMTMIKHIDTKTKAILGWEIMPSENTQAIAASLRRAMLWTGFLLTGDEESAFVPRLMLVDNGRAFKSRYFSKLKGDTLEHVGINGLFDDLRPWGFQRVRYAPPYRGQSKTIERIFGNFSELERSLESYTGTSIATRPAMFNRGEFLHREVAALVKQRQAITLWEAHLAVALWVHEYNNTPSNGRYLKGRTPYESLEESLEKIKQQPGFSERIVPADHLRWLMMREKKARLTRNGISLYGKDYLSPELHELAKGNRELIVRFDLDRMGSILVYYPNGEFLCEAKEWNSNGGHHPVAFDLGDERQKVAVSEAMKIRTAMVSRVKREAKQSLKDSAAAGFGSFLGRELVPDVQRVIDKGASLAPKKGKVAEVGYEEVVLPSEEQIREYRRKEAESRRTDAVKQAEMDAAIESVMWSKL